jgi:hypothetical protein
MRAWLGGLMSHKAQQNTSAAKHQRSKHHGEVEKR